MEARMIRLVTATLFTCAMLNSASAQIFPQFQQREFTANSENFIVFASSPQWAEQVARVAEQHRRDLAIHWLGEELPTWPERCPVHVHSAQNLGAQGETGYTLLDNGTAGRWRMSVVGTPERILDSVLPHEITHTIFAWHFASLGKYVPRWADEGACTTVEHEAEKVKHRQHLVSFLKNGRGLAFNAMFQLKEYPHDILPLYAQGHSAVQFLIDQGGPQKFVDFLEAGMKSEAWPNELNSFYGYKSIGDFQTMWNQWLADGSPEDLLAYAPGLQGSAEPVAAALASNVQTKGGDNTLLLEGSSEPAPLMLAGSPGRRSPNGTWSLASDPVSLPASAVAGLRSAGLSDSADGDGWYKRRLIEVSGAPASPVPDHNTVANGSLRTQARVSSSAYPDTGFGNPQSASRPLPAQGPGIQVLDWGNGGPIQGMQSPIYR